ncbi:DUF5690 family protein [Rubritalea tangerina]|uniref:DUF5690 family protein n=2 Tax=Rubritalea tangerina TaxID=430798 RepID=A0ABW4ZC73_9BACT
MIINRAILWNGLAVMAAFLTYYCMYAFRKPFSVLEYDMEWLGMGLKEVVVISQILGYTAAKFIGTRLCSGLHRENVFQGLLGCIVGALLSLWMMALLPMEWAIVCLFFNGLSLGMVWGMVMRPLEGRNASEFLMAGLCCSFIVASGDVKSAGKWLLGESWFQQWSGGNALWMPFALGVFYLIPFGLAAYLLTRLPKPSAEDIAARSERHAMSGEECRHFLRSCSRVLVPLALVYFMLTAYRDYRDNFQADLLIELGEGSTDIFSVVERRVAFFVIVVTGLLILFRNHLNALRASMSVMVLGLVMCVVVTVLRQSGTVSPMVWMMLTGVGAYLCYIPFNCILFERIVALTKSPGNAVFAIMLFDGVGYLGSIGLTAISGVLETKSRVQFFDHYTWVIGVLGITALLWSMVNLRRLSLAHEGEKSESCVGAGGVKSCA